MSYIEKKSSVFRTGSFVDVILTAMRNSTKSNQKENLSHIIIEEINLHTNIT
jgi:Flp pilus assembly protein CpaB